MSRTRKLSAVAVALSIAGFLAACSPGTSPARPNAPLRVIEPESVEKAEAEVGRPAEKQADPNQLVESPMNAVDPKREQTPTQKESPAGIPFSQVQAKNSRDNCWIVVLGNAYDFTEFVQQHPYGARLSLAVCGKDATETFQANADINDVVARLSPLYLGPVLSR